MELLLVPVPIFNSELAVELYLFRYQVANQTGSFTSEIYSPPMEALNFNDIVAFTGGKPIIVPVMCATLKDLAANCTQPPRLTVFLLEDYPRLASRDMEYIHQLREKGYRFAIHAPDNRDGKYDYLLRLVNFVLLDSNDHPFNNLKAAVLDCVRLNKRVSVVSINIHNREEFHEAQEHAFHMFEGPFYRLPVTVGQTEVTPIKANLIRMLNLVRDENFEFSAIAEVVSRDPALSFSLMRFINSPYIGLRHRVRSIQHAVTLLGQIEVRKWVTAAVFKSLGADHPTELTRLSLVRAKFAENLCPLFGLQKESPSLFLMGLFSVIDAVLHVSMEDALKKVLVSEDISDALIDGTGRYYPLFEFIQAYEQADWDVVLRRIVLDGFYVNEAYEAYLNAVSWYNELITEVVRPLRR